MSAATLVFDPLRHEYTVDGQRIPSVTQILRATGVSVDFEELAGISTRLGTQIEEKRALGTALHADAHALDDRDLDWATVDPRVRPYLEAWQTFRVNSGLVPLARERQLFHPTLRYAGTFDGLFLAPRGVTGMRVIADLKTGDPDDAGARYQLAAYQLAYQHEHPDQPIYERWSVQLTPEHRIPYRVTKYDDWRDFDVWKAIVTTYWAQGARRKERA
jgi:hypothetical protein